MIEPPGFSGLDLLVLGAGDRLAFERMAEAVAEAGAAQVPTRD